MNKIVYLCGPITGCTYGKCTDWRKYCAEIFPEIDWASPMRAKEYLKVLPVIGDKHPDLGILSSADSIVCRDMFDVRRCAMLLANFEGAERVSIGSVLEIGAAYALNKPIVTVLPKRNIHEHSMLRRMSSVVVDSLDEGLFVVRHILFPGI